MRVLSVASRFSDHPEEQLITISRIKDASCAYRYYKQYVDPQRPTKSFESIEAGLGQLFHSYVENHFKRILARDGTISRRDILDVDDLLANFRLSFLWEGRIRPPYRIVRSRYSVGDFISRLQIVAENFNKFLLGRMIGHRVLAVEGQLQIRTDSFYIRGKHDLITQEPSGSIVLWDWKTGNAPKPEYYEDFRNQKIQLGIYAVWMRYRYHNAVVRGTAVFLREGCVELSETFTTAVEQEVLAYAGTWRRKLNAQDSYPPILNNLCDWCGWNPVCPAYQDRLTSIPASAAYSYPRYSGSQSRQQTRSSCFIASCAFETADAPEVRLLRLFRDKHLLRMWGGTVAVRLYEWMGPAAAAIVGRRQFGRMVVKRIIQLLIVPLARRLMMASYRRTNFPE